MKTQIHPTYFEDTLVVCSCGHSFVTGSTKKEIRVEVCFKCHPLYTGEKRYVDTLGQVGKFQKKQETAQKIRETLGPKKKKKEKKGDFRPKTLRELLSEM